MREAHELLSVASLRKAFKLNGLKMDGSWMTKKRTKMVEVRLFIPLSVAEWIDHMVTEGELGRTRSSVIRSLLVGQKREVEERSR